MISERECLIVEFTTSINRPLRRYCH